MKGEDHYSNIPSTVVPTLLRIKDLLIFVFIQGVLTDNFSHEYLMSDEFRDSGLLHKHYHWMGNMLMRISTYIIGFCFMDCGPLASGLAYSGKDDDGKPLFEKARNVKIQGLIFTSQVKYFLACWNISTHEWLKNYVFMRML